MIYTMLATMPFMVCLFWTAVMATEWREAYAAKKVLTVFMALCAGLYFCHAVFFCNEKGMLTVANSAYAFCNLAVYPMYYLYICRLTNSKSLNKRQMLVLLPAIIIGIWATAIYSTHPNGEGQEAREMASKIIFIAQIIPICYFGIKRLKDFDRKIENNYADTEMRTVKQTRGIMMALAICSVCSAGANMIGRDYFTNSPIILAVPSLVFGTLLFSVGYAGAKQRFCIDDLEMDMGEEEEDGEDGEEMQNKEKEESEKEEDLIDQIKERTEALERLMTEERMYQKSDLRITEVADKMGIGRTLLSNLINQTMGMSFSEYINTIRVRKAQEMIEQNKESEMTITEIGEVCGFSSQTSFYRAFSKQTGMAPGQWGAMGKEIEEKKKC